MGNKNKVITLVAMIKVNVGVDKNVPQFYSQSSPAEAITSSSTVPNGDLSALVQADR
ncbi:hypothetical protein [Leuconostoc citreum]|uniref:hypothetical protein n=1 Tax=Leuconostoc citreum TaxID=33964 RepID=UPI0002466834|nr:hypothetical protein [Leuconostoc citreum]GEK61260.1 hypothetical protein LCI01_08960 [Leuconostoc citreum]CCF26372.1 Protein of unknown function [Leuconostoc citreum LBAE C11]CDX65151.1 Protein of unknown function [Leuconostoc citreum]